MVKREEFEDFVFLQALENAVSFKGKANPKALIGKCMPKFPDIKNEMGTWMPILNSIVEQVNSMNYEVQVEKLKELNSAFFDKKEKKDNVKKEGLSDLNGFKGRIRTRFCPAPSGHLHLGHLYGIVFNYEYVKKYGGEFLVRLEDTNPENIALENYDKILDDVKWITDDSIDEIYYQSDRIDVYYKYLRTLIETGKAYVCECEAEVFKAYNDSSEECPHRSVPVANQIKMYEKFFSGEYKEGDAIVRFKADLKNKNPALRDFPLARLKFEKHVRVGDKYKLWPMYNLCTAVDDSLMNVNYIIRGKDHEINGERQDMIKSALGLLKSNYFHYGRIKFLDIELSKTKLSEKIENKVYDGWDDPRVPSLISYRKRGYKAEAFRKMIVAMGISKRDSKITDEEYHKSLNFYNKQILEEEADRYFFVYNPKKVNIVNLDDIDLKEIELPQHPTNKSRGMRNFDLKSDYIIDGVDFKNFKVGDKIRLMHFANFKVVEVDKDELKLMYLSTPYNKELMVKRNIHFLPKDAEKCQVILSDNSKLNGYCEDMDNIKENTSIQFERFGFVKYDSKNKDGMRVFYFTHR
ncbi:MAG: glutamate--tRNA ligase [Nanoarchaeota archaeon]|nr:glutamate--tRNA ligase [Nanoarchaeota archaeon]